MLQAHRLASSIGKSEIDNIADRREQCDRRRRGQLFGQVGQPTRRTGLDHCALNLDALGFLTARVALFWTARLWSAIPFQTLVCRPSESHEYFLVILEKKAGMFTRIHTDACSISDRDLRNRSLFDYELSALPSFRRGQTLNSQIYGTTQQGLEMDFELEGKLFGLGRVAGDCNGYDALVQANLQASTDPTPQICIGHELQPAYTRGVRSWRHFDTYQNGRSRVLDYAFVSPPLEHVGIGEYSVNRYSDTVQNAKDSLAAENKQLLKKFYGKQGPC